MSYDCCYICDGPIYNLLHAPSVYQIPGLNEGDKQWLETVVLVYADCISPRGELDDDTFLLPYTKQQKYLRNSSQLEDPVHVPEWACENQPGMAKYVDLAHELCIRLAAEWSRELFPSRFNKFGALVGGRTDPSKFLWNIRGPYNGFFSDAEFRNEDDVTRDFAKASVMTQNRLGELETAFIDWGKASRCGYNYDPPEWSGDTAETQFGIISQTTGLLSRSLSSGSFYEYHPNSFTLSFDKQSSS
ncbi:hypothetical protein C8J56DRAFT_940770 [Mycena floridula]|nr:hypothetical protein C8J56DRAFT_940770 [Mycena floridula]